MSASLIQSNSGNSDTRDFSATFGEPATAGNVLIASVTGTFTTDYFSTGVSLPGFTDYQQDEYSSTPGIYSIIYAKVAAGGETLIEGSFTGEAPGICAINIYEFSGIAVPIEEDAADQFVGPASAGTNEITGPSGGFGVEFPPELVFYSLMTGLAPGSPSLIGWANNSTSDEPHDGVLQYLSAGSDHSIFTDMYLTTAEAEPNFSISVTFSVGADSSAALLGVAFPTSTGAPTVSEVNPPSGSTSGGTDVTISGTGFSGPATVDFGPGNPATDVVVVSDEEITCVSPSGSGTVDVTVTTTEGTSADNPPFDQFTYESGPTITGVSPPSGTSAGGTPVTITGTNFASPATVEFGTSAATSVVVVDSMHITCDSPAHGAGIVDVRVTTPGGTSPIVSADEFTYIAPETRNLDYRFVNLGTGALTVQAPAGAMISTPSGAASSIDIPPGEGREFQFIADQALWGPISNAPGSSTPATSVTGPDSFGSPSVVGTSLDYARQDHDHGLPASPAPSFAAPALTLGTANAAGSSGKVLSTDSTVAAFDATNPTTLTFGESPATGGAAVAARRDHAHGMPESPESFSAPTVLPLNPITTTTTLTATSQPGQFITQNNIPYHINLPAAPPDGTFFWFMCEISLSLLGEFMPVIYPSGSDTVNEGSTFTPAPGSSFTLAYDEAKADWKLGGYSTLNLQYDTTGGVLLTAVSNIAAVAHLAGSIQASPGNAYASVMTLPSGQYGGLADIFWAPTVPNSQLIAPRVQIDPTGTKLLMSHARFPCRLATAAALPSYAAGHPSSFDYTLTATSNGALTVDGVAVAAGDRILVKNETGGNAPYNGIYFVVQAGSGSSGFFLQRAWDMVFPFHFPGATTTVAIGTQNAGTQWECTNDPDSALTINTTNITFAAPVPFAISASTIAKVGSVPLLGASGQVPDAAHQHPTSLWLPANHGLITWVSDPINATTDIQPASGSLTLLAVNVPIAASITNVLLVVDVAGATLTTALAGIYQNNLLIASTASQTAAWTAAGTFSMALSGGPYAVSAGQVFIAILLDGTTTPNFIGFATTAGRSNMNYAAPGLNNPSGRFLKATTAVTSLPANLTTAGLTFAKATPIYGALS